MEEHYPIHYMESSSIASALPDESEVVSSYWMKLNDEAKLALYCLLQTGEDLWNRVQRVNSKWMIRRTPPHETMHSSIEFYGNLFHFAADQFFKLSL